MKKELFTKWWFWLLCSLVFLIAVHVLFKLSAPGYWLEPTWSAGELLSFAGTIVLGFVAVFQTRQANNISRRLMEKEINEAMPYVDLRPLTAEKLNKYKKHEVFYCFVDGYHARFDDECKLIQSDGETLYFLIKNVRDTDILSICVSTIQIGVYAEGEILDKKEYVAQNSFYGDSINGNAELPFIVTVPEDVFVKVAAYVKDHLEKSNACSLYIEFCFHMTNIDGNVYRENISMNVVNVQVLNSVSHFFTNKKLSKPEEEKEVLIK